MCIVYILSLYISIKPIKQDMRYGNGRVVFGGAGVEAVVSLAVLSGTRTSAERNPLI